LLCRKKKKKVATEEGRGWTFLYRYEAELWGDEKEGGNITIATLQQEGGLYFVAHVIYKKEKL